MSINATLFSIQARRWLTRRGFIGVLAVAALPLLLTGAWLVTHADDVAATRIEWSPQEPVAGENVTITATVSNLEDRHTDPFNATLRVGFVEDRFGDPTFNTLTSETTRVDGLAPGEVRQITLTWRAEAGTFRFDLRVDTDDDLSEIEELNNDRFEQVFIEPQEITDFPTVGGVGDPDANASTDLAITDVSLPDSAFVEKPANITVQVRNAGPGDIENGTVRLQTILPPTAEGRPQTTEADLEEPLTLAAGEETDIRFSWEPGEVSQYVLFAIADPGSDLREEEAADNQHIQVLFVDREVIYEEPPEKATIKEFFVQVISGLQVRIVIPLLALFYAAGVLADPRSGGALVYLLTRPIPRWSIPLTRFITSFAVAFVAIVVGSLLSFLVLLQTPQGNVGFLTAPLAISAMALFAYTAVFTLLGVVTRHPYLWGLAFVVGWETFAGSLVPWVDNLTLNHHLTQVFQGMELDQGAVWFPSGAEATGAAWRLLLIGFGTLLAAAVVMTRREFQDA